MVAWVQAGLLLEEAAAAAGQSGHSLEASSVLTPLLSGTEPPNCTGLLDGAWTVLSHIAV